MRCPKCKIEMDFVVKLDATHLEPHWKCPECKMEEDNQDIE